MAEYLMETMVRMALWQQFGAAIDMLKNAVVACPETLWQEHLWSDAEGPHYGTFWEITSHTLFWLDVYLTAEREGFASPMPFIWNEQEIRRILPQQPFPKEVVHAYLIRLRKKCQTTIISLSDDRAHQLIALPSIREKPTSFFELQLSSMRHVQEHAAQLSLFLGQHATPDAPPDWVG
jgi:DinB superfamily